MMCRTGHRQFLGVSAARPALVVGAALLLWVLIALYSVSPAWATGKKKEKNQIRPRLQHEDELPRTLGRRNPPPVENRRSTEGMRR